MLFFPFCPPPPCGMPDEVQRRPHLRDPMKNEVCFLGTEPIPPGSAERKKKLKLSVLCALSERSEWAVKNFQINVRSAMCCKENGNNIMLLVVKGNIETI
jgi:hypothetical protein